MPVSIDVEKFCFPIYLIREEAAGALPLAFFGTCFILPGGVAITCRHCLPLDVEAGAFLGIAVDGPEKGQFSVHELFDRSHDPSGADLASARVNWGLTASPLLLLEGAGGLAYHVATYGYPGTIGTLPDGKLSGPKVFHQHSRFGRGYVSRDFQFADPNRPGKPRRMWEVDLPTPVGASGGPLLWVKDGVVQPLVMGVICGSHPERREDLKGDILPDYIFGLAEHSVTLNALRGKALEDRTLLEYMETRGLVVREKED